MANQYYNISYDPLRQGFDTDTWRLVYGDAAVVGGQLRLTKAAIIHYGDILRGDAVFSINIGTPALGDNTEFGFIQYNKNAYAVFQIVDGVLTAEVSNGTITRTSATIAWNTDWTDVDTEFGIKWEAGSVTFTIGGQFKARIDDASATDAIALSVIPGCPMSLYVASDSPDLFLLDYIVVKAIQSYVMSTGNADSTFEILVKESDKVNISSVVTDIKITPLHTNNGIIAETPKIREVATVYVEPITSIPTIIETPKIRESVTMFTDIYDDMGIVTETPKIREDITVETPA